MLGLSTSRKLRCTVNGRIAVYEVPKETGLPGRRVDKLFSILHDTALYLKEVRSSSDLHVFFDMATTAVFSSPVLNQTLFCFVFIIIDVRYVCQQVFFYEVV